MVIEDSLDLLSNYGPVDVFPLFLPIPKIMLLQLFFVTYIIYFLKMFSHRSFVGGLVTHWVLYEITILLTRQHISNAASNVDKVIVQQGDRNHKHLKTKNKLKQ